MPSWRACASAIGTASLRVRRMPCGCAALKRGMSSASDDDAGDARQIRENFFHDGWIGCMITALVDYVPARREFRALHFRECLQRSIRQRRNALPRYALAILTLINLFNYLDRWVVAAVVESIKKSELHLSDTQLGLVGTGFIVVYTLTSPLFGALGDRRKRPPLIALGVAVWSVATSLAGFARGFVSLFIARSAVGVGEAAYGTIAPALLADSFPIERRGRVLAVFFCAIPIGSAAGYILGGLVDQHFGWRAAFWIAGAPGLLLALLVLLVKDPPRGLHDAARSKIAHRRIGPSAYRDLFRNRPFILTALGYGAYTFALGGLGFWMPAFLERVRGMPRSEATVTFGAIALVTGFVGTFAGGWLGDFFLRRSKQSYLWVSGIATLHRRAGDVHRRFESASQRSTCRRSRSPRCSSSCAPGR